MGIEEDNTGKDITYAKVISSSTPPPTHTTNLYLVNKMVKCKAMEREECVHGQRHILNSVVCE